jgi:hypothetical protein
VPEKTLKDLIVETHAAIVLLRELIDREYPDRAEVERRFTRKGESNRKLAFGLVLMFITVVLSYFMTVTTISSCFLGGAEHGRACNVLPGYKESVNRNNDLIKQFIELQRRSMKNERRIDRLEKEAGIQ